MKGTIGRTKYLNRLGPDTSSDMFSGSAGASAGRNSCDTCPGTSLLGFSRRSYEG